MFSKLSQANLKINVEKCTFMRSEVVVLGHLVNLSGICPNLRKIKAIQQMAALTDVTGVKEFLGTIDFYQRFISDCAKESDLIVELT